MATSMPATNSPTPCECEATIDAIRTYLAQVHQRSEYLYSYTLKLPQGLLRSFFEGEAAAFKNMVRMLTALIDPPKVSPTPLPEADVKKQHTAAKPKTRKRGK